MVNTLLLRWKDSDAGILCVVKVEVSEALSPVELAGLWVDRGIERGLI